jgi:hypothetical protein
VAIASIINILFMKKVDIITKVIIEADLVVSQIIASFLKAFLPNISVN